MLSHPSHPCLTPSTVPACLLAVASSRTTPLLLIPPLPPSLSLCFSFATLCTRVKTILFCLRAVMMGYIYSFLLTGFPPLCRFPGLVCSSFVRTQPLVYISSPLLDLFCTRKWVRGRARWRNTWITLPDSPRWGRWHLWDQTKRQGRVVIQRARRVRRQIRRRQKRMRECAAPLSDGSGKISLVSVDSVLPRFDPKRVGEGLSRCRPHNPPTLRPKSRGLWAPLQSQRSVATSGRIGDRSGRG